MPRVRAASVRRRVRVSLGIDIGSCPRVSERVARCFTTSSGSEARDGARGPGNGRRRGPLPPPDPRLQGQDRRHDSRPCASVPNGSYRPVGSSRGPVRPDPGQNGPVIPHPRSASPVTGRRSPAFVGIAVALVAGLVVRPLPSSGTGPSAPAPSFPATLLAWSFDPTVAIPLLVAGLPLPVGEPPGRPGAPGQPEPADPGRLLAGRPRGDLARPPVADRALRHDPLRGPHGPAHPADPDRAAAARPGRPDHPPPARLPTGDPPPGHPAGPPLVAGQGGHLPGLHLGLLRPGDVGDPLLADVRPLARGAGRPPARAPPLSRRRLSLLVAGGRARPEPVADERAGPDPLHLPPDAPELVPRAGDHQRDGAAVRPLRDARSATGAPMS